MARTSGILVPILLCACLYVVSSAVIEQKAAASNGVAAPVNRQLLREQAAARVEKINKSGKKWKAKLHPKFADQTKEELRLWLGLAMDPSEHIKHRQERAAKLKLPGLELEKKKKKTTTTQAPTTTTSSTTQAPTTTTEEPEDESFDAREEWPECADVISKIQDQSACGSCWAVSSASVMQDRICIASEGKKKVNISAEDVMSCVTKSYGCSGGWPQHAFEFYQQQGVCTGSDYESKLGCKPYPIPPHADHMYSTPRCKKRCENRKYKENKYKNDKHFGLEPVNLQDSEEEDIMEAIQEGGPVEANMIVYDDFFAYSEGVYEVSDDAEQAGGHAVRIIGWGYDEEEDIPYWLVANSWNTDWGDEGYFKIARGQDECYIESWGINYSEPDLDHAAVAH